MKRVKRRSAANAAGDTYQARVWALAIVLKPPCRDLALRIEQVLKPACVQTFIPQLALCAINKGARVYGDGLTANVIWSIVQGYRSAETGPA